MSWIHCRVCGMVKGTNTQHFISNCKHIFCKSCLAKYAPQCIVCRKTARFIELNDQMPSNVRVLFEPTAPKIQAIHQANNFQLVEQTNFCEQNLSLVDHYENLNREIKCLKETNKRKIHDYNEEVALIRKLKEAICDLKANSDTSPAFNSNNLDRSFNSLDRSNCNFSESFKSASLESSISFDTKRSHENHDSGLGSGKHHHRRSLNKNPVQQYIQQRPTNRGYSQILFSPSRESQTQQSFQQNYSDPMQPSTSRQRNLSQEQGARGFSIENNFPSYQPSVFSQRPRK